MLCWIDLTIMEQRSEKGKRDDEDEDEEKRYNWWKIWALKDALAEKKKFGLIHAVPLLWLQILANLCHSRNSKPLFIKKT